MPNRKENRELPYVFDFFLNVKKTEELKKVLKGEEGEQKKLAKYLTDLHGIKIDMSS